MLKKSDFDPHCFINDYFYDSNKYKIATDIFYIYVKKLEEMLYDTFNITVKYWYKISGEYYKKSDIDKQSKRYLTS